MNDMTKSHPNEGHGEHGGGHVVAGGTLLRVFGALLVLTVVTVLVSRVHLGQWNVVVALAVACAKAALVAAFFMHLKYEGRFNLVVLLSSLAFVVVLVTFVLKDSRTYQPDIRQYREDHPAGQAKAAPAPQSEKGP